MSYVRESGYSKARRRRRRRSAIIVTLVAVILVGGFGYAVAYVKGWVAHPTLVGQSCKNVPISKSGIPTPGSVTVNVYNATGRQGVASATATILRARGFHVGSITNDPLREKVTGVAQIRYGSAGAAAAKGLLSKEVHGARLVLDGRLGGSVDVVIGKKFTTLVRDPKLPVVRMHKVCTG